MVLDALEQAIHSRGMPENVIHHSDRGVQYLSIRYTNRLEAANLRASVGTTGDSYDNALAETVNGLYKTEVIEYLKADWQGLGDVQLATLNWVDWFNKESVHRGVDQGEGKTRFLNAVSAMSQAFALAVPHPNAMEAAPVVAFFQAVKARLAKFNDGSGKISGMSNAALEAQVKQTIDQALVTEQVVDIFDAAGIQKPDISILSDEFMQEMKGYRHKNIALETLKKLLGDEIKMREQRSVTQGKKLMDMLSSAIKSYQNKVLTAAEVIDELIKLAKAIQESDKLAEELNLTEYEYAFYSAVADNDSARELMQKEILRELAVVLTESIRKNVTLDWTIKEAARAKLRVIVKRLLKKYGYPPDMALLATETVLEQAEQLAHELSVN